jgi:hypothetical protein
MVERERPPRLHRRCSACGAVHPSAEFPRVERTRSWGAAQRLRCPACGHEGPSPEFLRLSPAEVRGMGGDPG